MIRNSQSELLASTAGTCPLDGMSIGAKRMEPCLVHSETRIVPWQHLPPTVLQNWHNWHQSSPNHASPYFDPQFTRAVDAIRDDVRIALFLNRQRVVVGLLPYQHNLNQHADPIGGRLNDFHGVIGVPEFRVDWEKFLDAADLRSFSFHAASSGLGDLEPYRFEHLSSHEIDVSGGADEYFRWAFGKSSTLRRQAQKTRALARHLGPIRFVFQSADAMGLEWLIEKKRQRYQRSLTFDILSVDWAANLLREIHGIQEGRLQPVLSELWAGPHRIAAHFGMLNDRVLHYWFPVYDRQFARYSPGTLLLLETIRAADGMVDRIDLSYGDDPYKFKFSNSRSVVASGLVCPSRLRHQILKRRYTIRKRLKTLPGRHWAKKVVRTFYPRYGHWHYR